MLQKPERPGENLATDKMEKGKVNIQPSAIGFQQCLSTQTGRSATDKDRVVRSEKPENTPDNLCQYA